MPRPDTLEPGTQVGHWRVVESVGVGGQGAVYRVEDVHHPGDFYALKLALHARDARAEREAVLMMSQAAHPHVVRFHGCTRWPHPREGRLGFVMDWVPGLALDAWAETAGTTFRQLAGVGATVARTLGELHARGVLHRDLKPEYLLTPEAVRFLWASPEHPDEHYLCRPADDLYALGVCLYRATTGHYPFSEWMPRGMLQMAIAYGRPPSPRRINPRVPRELSDVIERLLAKKPSKRYPSGEALHEALVKAAQGEGAEWDASIFEWEEFPPARQGAPAERHAVLPAPPRLAWPFSAHLEVALARYGRWVGTLALAAVLLLLVSVFRLGLFTPGVSLPEKAATKGRVEMDATTPEQAPAPGRTQKRAPCTAGLEVEVSGACWLPHALRPPDCPRQTVAYQGKCLWPVPKPPAVPTSVDGGEPDNR